MGDGRFAEAVERVMDDGLPPPPEDPLALALDALASDATLSRAMRDHIRDQLLDAVDDMDRMLQALATLGLLTPLKEEEEWARLGLRRLELGFGDG